MKLVRLLAAGSALTVNSCSAVGWGSGVGAGAVGFFVK